MAVAKQQKPTRKSYALTNFGRAATERPVLPQTSVTQKLFGMSERHLDSHEIPVRLIDFNPDQPRKYFDPDALAGLAQSLKDKGQFQPVGIKKSANGRYILEFGERRLRAALMNEWPTISAVILPADANMDEVALIENVQREDLTPMEEALAIKRLLTANEGQSQAGIAILMGKSETYISASLSLTNLHATIQDALLSGADISKSVLIELSRLKPREQMDLWPKVQDGMTVVQIRLSKRAPGAAAPVTARAFPVKNLGTVTNRLGLSLDAIASKNKPLDPQQRLQLQALETKIASLLKR
jgi:ParB family chromosome partitioning protein